MKKRHLYLRPSDSEREGNFFTHLALDALRRGRRVIILYGQDQWSPGSIMNRKGEDLFQLLERWSGKKSEMTVLDGTESSMAKMVRRASVLYEGSGDSHLLFVEILASGHQDPGAEAARAVDAILRMSEDYPDAMLTLMLSTPRISEGSCLEEPSFRSSLEHTDIRVVYRPSYMQEHCGWCVQTRDMDTVTLLDAGASML